MISRPQLKLEPNYTVEAQSSQRINSIGRSAQSKGRRGRHALCAMLFTGAPFFVSRVHQHDHEHEHDPFFFTRLRALRASL